MLLLLLLAQIKLFSEGWYVILKLHSIWEAFFKNSF